MMELQYEKNSSSSNTVSESAESGKRRGLSSEEHLLGGKESVDQRHVRGRKSNIESSKRFALAQYRLCRGKTKKTKGWFVDMSV